MINKNITAGLLLFVFAFASGCGGRPPAAGTPASTPTPTAAATPAPTPTATSAPTPTPDPIAAAVAGMSTEEKVGQLLVAGFEGTAAGADAVTAIEDYQVGGVILFSRNVDSAGQLAALTNRLKEINGEHIPLFLCIDEEGGRVSRMPREVADLPSAFQFIRDGGDGGDRGRVLAAACAAFGFQMNFAPSLDIWSNSDNTVIGDRAFGTDEGTVTGAGIAAVSAMAQAGVIPVVKHFPGHGDTAADSHRELPVVDKSVEALEQEELAPFRAAIDQGAPAVMVGHILMAALDPERPATLSPAVVTELLRGELGFEGVVCTDDLTMGAITNTWGMGEAAVLSVEAGCDLLLVCHGTDNLTAARNALLAAVAEGRISAQRLDESVYRLLALKADYRVSNDPVPAPDVEALNAQIAGILPVGSK